LLLGLFFMIVGMSINLPLVVAQWPKILLLTLACMTIKTAIMAVLGRILGLGWLNGVRVGLLLAQVGEFAFVVFERASQQNLLTPADSQLLMAIVALSMVLTPVLAALGRRIAVRHQRQTGEQLHAEEGSDFNRHVVIAGYGRIGQAIAHQLDLHHIPYVALDQDPERVIKARKSGLPVFYGDASQAGVLRSIGIQSALAAVVTVNRPRSAEKTVAAMRGLNSTLTIIVRAQDVGQENLFSTAGATALVPETMEASLQMASLVLRSAGIPANIVADSMERQRNHYRGTLDHAGLSDTLPR
jgi:monovalent cation:H+ antiporter-2, CPA2 family